MTRLLPTQLSRGGGVAMSFGAGRLLSLVMGPWQVVEAPQVSISFSIKWD